MALWLQTIQVETEKPIQLLKSLLKERMRDTTIESEEVELICFRMVTLELT